MAPACTAGAIFYCGWAYRLEANADIAILVIMSIQNRPLKPAPIKATPDLLAAVTAADAEMAMIGSIALEDVKDWVESWGTVAEKSIPQARPPSR